MNTSGLGFGRLPAHQNPKFLKYRKEMNTIVKLLRMQNSIMNRQQKSGNTL